MLSCLRLLGQEDEINKVPLLKYGYSYEIMNTKVDGVSTTSTCTRISTRAKRVTWRSEVDESYISAFLHSKLMWALEFSISSKLLVRVLHNEIYKGETNVKKTITKRE